MLAEFSALTRAPPGKTAMIPSCSSCEKASLIAPRLALNRAAIALSEGQPVALAITLIKNFAAQNLGNLMAERAACRHSDPPLALV